MNINPPKCHTFRVLVNLKGIDNLIFRFDIENHYDDSTKNIEILLHCSIYENLKECIYTKCGLQLSIENFFFDADLHLDELHNQIKICLEKYFSKSGFNIKIPPLPIEITKEHQVNLNKLKNIPLFGNHPIDGNLNSNL